MDTAKKHFFASMKKNEKDISDETIEKRWGEYDKHESSKALKELLEDVQRQSIKSTLELVASQVSTLNKQKDAHNYVMNLQNHEHLKIG